MKQYFNILLTSIILGISTPTLAKQYQWVSSGFSYNHFMLSGIITNGNTGWSLTDAYRYDLFSSLLNRRLDIETNEAVIDSHGSISIARL